MDFNQHGEDMKKKKVVKSGVQTHNLGGMSSALCHLGYSTIGPIGTKSWD